MSLAFVSKYLLCLSKVFNVGFAYLLLSLSPNIFLVFYHTRGFVFLMPSELYF